MVDWFKPDPEAVITAAEMDFPNAIRQVAAGLRISRKEWEDPHLYGVLRNGLLMIHLADGWHAWTISDGDLLAEDWYVVPHSTLTSAQS